MRQELQEIKRHIYEDGDISASEVKLLKDVFAAGFGDEEAEMLLDLNTVLSGNDHSPDFTTLFVDTLTAFSVSGDTLPPAKWTWLKAHLLRDNVIDGVEAQLLARIAQLVKDLPADFPKV